MVKLTFPLHPSGYLHGSPQKAEGHHRSLPGVRKLSVASAPVLVRPSPWLRGFYSRTFYSSFPQLFFFPPITKPLLYFSSGRFQISHANRLPHYLGCIYFSSFSNSTISICSILSVAGIMVPFKRREGGDDNVDDGTKGKADPDSEAVPAISALGWFYAATFVAVVFGLCLGLQACHHTLGLAKPM